MVNQSQFIEMFGDTFQNERGWTFKKLPEVSTIVLGSTPSSSNAAFWDGDIKWITPAELSDDSFYLYDSERHITEEGVKSTSLKPFPAGTVILSTRAPIGKTAIAGCEMYCNQGFKNFICDNTINPVYLFYTLRIHNPELQKMGTGSTFLELSKKAIEQISISVPPKKLQDEFEQFYKQADKSKFAGFKSQFIEMTKASNYIKIENVAKDVFAGGDKPKDHSAVQSEQYKYPVFSNGIGDNALLCFSKECRVKEAAITVSARGTIGYAECREAGFTPVVRLLTLIPKEGYQLAYLKFALNSITFHSTGSSQGQLTAPDFCKYEIPNAPFDVQVVFGSIVQQADKSKYLN